MENTKKFIMESNVISDEEFKKRASGTLSLITHTLSKSLGYYGSTTIIEDPIFGNVITKDGFTILKSLKFGMDDTISNTILKMIKDISQTLVMEVGDGSTSSIVTSNKLFEILEYYQANIETFSNLPKRIIMDKLHNLEKIITKELKNIAVPINEDNFDIISSIASVSNNNDDKAGNIIYEIYNKIGKDGFIYMEDTDADSDFFEITNGIETARGFIDNVYATKSNKMEAEYIEPKIILINGTLDKSDIDWFKDLLGNFYSTIKKPLVIVASHYTKEFSDFLKINKLNNSNAHFSLEMGVTTFNTDSKEVYEDLSIYLDTAILDKNDPDMFYKEIECFVKNDFQGKLVFNDRYLGGCEKVLMNTSTTQFIEGNASEEVIQSRVDSITNTIEYYEGLANKKDITSDLFKLNKRIGNLTSKVAKLYVSGSTETERSTRKYLLEDSIFACKSALNNGYISGGNLAIPKIINNVIMNSELSSEFDDIDMLLLDSIAISFEETYAQVLRNSNMFSNKAEIANIIDECEIGNKIYNLKTREFESDSETRIINSVMTDINIMKASFSIIGLLVTSNQYIQKMPTRM